MTAPAVVRERPILFSGPMVRAILDGSKTQTRRVLLPQPNAALDYSRRVPRLAGADGGVSSFECVGVDVATGRSCWEAKDERGPVHAFRDGRDCIKADIACPYGAPGDRLWVRESWGTGGYFPWPYAYRADGKEYLGEKWRPSIHMPRRACRLVLDLTDVRVERIRDISAEDCRAEGAAGGDSTNEIGWRYSFGSIWNELNEKRGYGWMVNPFVWALSFRRVEP